jgi:polyhydroxyalkanoate synthesis regulator phasin
MKDFKAELERRADKHCTLVSAGGRKYGFDHEAEKNFLAGADAALEILAEREPSSGYADLHGCLTGDCPHDNANQCVRDLGELIGEMKQEHQSSQAKLLQRIGELEAEAEKWKAQLIAAQKCADSLDAEVMAYEEKCAQTEAALERAEASLDYLSCKHWDEKYVIHMGSPAATNLWGLIKIARGDLAAIREARGGKA